MVDPRLTVSMAAVQYWPRMRSTLSVSTSSCLLKWTYFWALASRLRVFETHQIKSDRLQKPEEYVQSMISEET